MTDQAVVDPVVPAVEVPVAAVEPLTEEQDYDTEFNALVAKRESEKAGTAVVADPEPAKEPATIEPAPVEKEPAKVAAKVEPDESWLANVPEAQRDSVKARLAAASAAEAKAAKLELDNRSMAGRMSAYQRKYEEAAGKRPVEVAKQATAEQSAEWTQFKEDYPDIAKAIEGRVPAQAGIAPEMKDVVEFVENEKRQRFLNDAWEAVETIHPGWRKTGATPEFRAWKESSTTYEKLASSDDVADAVALFDLYRAHQSVAAPKVDPAAQASANALAARRDAQTEGARAPNNRAATPNQNVDLADADQLFAFYANKSNQRMKARNS